MNTTTRERFRFFLEHAGYATPPGRAACALELARAEQWADEHEHHAGEDEGLCFRVEPDDDPDLSWMTERDRAELHEAVGVVPCVNGRKLYEFALWGIIDPSQDYLRVVKAELAAQMRGAGILFPECA